MRLLTAISYGLKDLLLHKKIVLLVFMINVLFGIVAVTPIRSIITQSLGATHYPNLLSQDFDFVIWTDLIREYLSSIGLGFQLLSIIMGVYIMWTIFYIGGFTGLAVSNGVKSSSSIFWSEGARYFFRFLRLTFYIILFYLLIVALLLWYIGITDLHILEMESEMELIFRLKVSAGILVLFIYLVSVFKELAKIAIARSDESLITTPLLYAAKQTCSIKYLVLGLVLSLLLGIIFIMYYILSVHFGFKPMFLSILILPQILLLLRIAIRYVRLSAYSYMSKTDLPLS